MESGLHYLGLSSVIAVGGVFRNASELPTAAARMNVVAGAGEGLFALIDPLRLNRCPFDKVLERLAGVIRPEVHAIALVFTYGDLDWPVNLSPAERLCRVGRLRNASFYLAAYATQRVARDTARVLDRFGWSCESP